MTRDEARGQTALKHLDEYTEPRCFFIGEGNKLGRKLYALERKRADLIQEIAKVWARLRRSISLSTGQNRCRRRCTTRSKVIRLSVVSWRPRRS